MEFQTPPEVSSRDNKSLFLILIALVIVAIIIGYTFFSAKHEITGLEVSMKTATFLDQMTEPNTMAESLVCSAITSQCSSKVLNANTPDLSGAIFGYLGLAEVSGEQSYKVKAGQVADFLLRECKTNFQMCDWNTSAIANLYLDTKNEKYLSALYSPIKKLFTLSNQDFINKNAGESLAILYQATGDESYKVRLLEVADEALANWPSGQNNQEPSMRAVQAVLLPAYAVSKDKKYLGASEQFFNNFNLAENVNLNQMSLDSVIRGTEALLLLSKVSENVAAYKSQVHLVLQEVLYQSWDSKENPKSNGDHGFGYALEVDSNFIKRTIDSGRLVRLFAEVADEKFGLTLEK